MVQQIQVLIAKTDALNLILSTHKVEGETGRAQIVFWPTYTYTHTEMGRHGELEKVEIFKNKFFVWQLTNVTKLYSTDKY